MYSKIMLTAALVSLLSGCARSAPESILTAAPSSTHTAIPTATETLALTATPEATATPEPTATLEPREFVPANDIEFVESLPDYNLELRSDADRDAIYWDAIHNQVGFATSKSKGFESNRAIYEAIIKDHPEWEGIGLSSDYETVIDFMKEFLKRSGGKMIIADASFNKYTVDFNLPVKFEVILVNELPQNYSSYIAKADDTNRGGGGTVYASEDGQLTYSVAVVPGALEDTQIDPAYIYKSWNWTPAEVLSDLFRQLISETIYKDRDSEKMKYQLYTKGGVPRSGSFYADTYWTFIR